MELISIQCVSAGYLCYAEMAPITIVVASFLFYLTHSPKQARERAGCKRGPVPPLSSFSLSCLFRRVSEIKEKASYAIAYHPLAPVGTCWRYEHRNMECTQDLYSTVNLHRTEGIHTVGIHVVKNTTKYRHVSQ